MFKRTPLSFSAFIFSCVFLTAIAFYGSKWGTPFYRSYIKYDISGYYMYLPGFFYDNLGEMKNQQYIIDHYHPCGNDLNQHIGPIGKYVIKYSSGMALMYLPAFSAGHIYAKIAHYPVDGFSYPYEVCLAMYSLLISFLGLWIARKVLLRFFSDRVAAITVVSLPLATNYLQYAALSNQLSHNYLFTLYALIIYLSIKWHQEYDYKRSTVIGLLCGLCALIRPTEVISIIIPWLWGVGSLTDLKQRFLLLLQQRKKLVVMILAAILVGLIQLIYWKTYTGHFLYWSYDNGDELNFLKVNFWNGLFSYKKGWFLYTPFMFLSIVGFITLYKSYRKLFWVSVVHTFLALYIVFSWKCWWYGGSFSMRAVVQYYAILILPLAAFIEYCLKRKLTTILFALFFVFCVWYNLLMHWQANVGGNIDSDNESGKYYWKVFGQIHADKGLKKFLDTDEEVPVETVALLKPVFTGNFCRDSTLANCGEFNKERIFIVDKSVRFIPETRIDVTGKKGKWFRVSIDAYIEQFGGNYWTEPKLYAWLTDSEKKPLKQKSYRIQRIAEPASWGNFSIDIWVPEQPEVKYLDAGIINEGADVKIFVRNISIECAEK